MFCDGVLVEMGGQPGPECFTEWHVEGERRLGAVVEMLNFFFHMSRR